MSRPYNRPEFYTYADYYAWPDSVRGELIDGEFHDSPSPTNRHQRIVVVLSTQLETFFRGKTCRTFVAPFDVRLPEPGQEEGAIVNVVQPDVTLVCDQSKLDERGCLGAPDWVVEVLSAETRKKDLTEKRDLYARHRVPLYWLISPTKRTITALKLADDGEYSSHGALSCQGRMPVPEYPGLEIDWDWVFD